MTPNSEKLILIAEDNLTLSHAFAKHLERLGFAVRAVADGKEVVAEATKARYDLIFMDLMLPELTGFQATHAIRQLEKVSGLRTPIVAMTATEVNKTQCIEAGMDDVVHKPVTRERLEAVLSRWAPA